jgi:hypothetical protein
MERNPAMQNKSTFTQLLLREIRAHFEHKAADGSVPSHHADVYYAVSREIGRMTPQFVAEARRKLAWHDAVEAHEEAARGR